MKSLIQAGLVSLSSALVGGLAVVSLQVSRTEGRSVAPIPSAATSSVQVLVQASSSDPELIHRLAKLEQQLAKGEKEEASYPTYVEEAPIDHAEAEALAEERRGRQAAKFSAEVMDRRWAIETARTFETDLGSFEGGNFRAGTVECRSSTCRTQLTWDSYEDARAEAKKVVQFGYAANCAKEIFTPRPEGNSEGPYTATLYFYCENLHPAVH